MNKVLSLERGFWSGLFVAATLAVTPAPSNGIPPLLASVSFAARAANRKVTAMLNYGTFEGFPAIWDSSSDYGFVLWKDSEGWRKIPSYELNHNAGVMSKEKFEKEFPNLPPLTKLAS